MQKHKLLKLDAAQAKSLAWADLPYDYIIGVDEVGRGCLAGPVVAGSVVFSTIVNPDISVDEINVSPTQKKKEFKKTWSEYKDSKSISENIRNELCLKIRNGHVHSLGLCDQTEIDEINILRASLLAMKRSIVNLNLPSLSSKLVLIDGNQFIGDLDGYDQMAIIKGDKWIPLISAASIVAKVHRDSLMGEYETQYPGFGFHEHKGYATQGHRDAIAKLGVTVIHRKSFKGVKEHVL